MEVTNSVIVCMGVAMALCFVIPFAYYVVIRKKVNHVVLLLGLTGYSVFGYIIPSFLQGLLPVDLSPLVYAFSLSLLFAVTQEGGRFVMLKLIRKKYDGPGVPLSYGLGYSVIYLLLIGGANMFTQISTAMALNNNGLEVVLSSVDESLRAEFEQTLIALTETKAHVYVLGGLEMAAFFAVSIAMSVIVWYVVTGKIRVWHLPAAILINAVYSFASAFYSQGGTDNLILTECIFFAVAIAVSVWAYMLFRKIEGPDPVPAADPVNRFDIIDRLR